MLVVVSRQVVGWHEKLLVGKLLVGKLLVEKLSVGKLLLGKLIQIGEIEKLSASGIVNFSNFFREPGDGGNVQNQGQFDGGFGLKEINTNAEPSFLGL